jgi:hypothetical protein
MRDAYSITLASEIDPVLFAYALRLDHFDHSMDASAFPPLRE